MEVTTLYGDRRTIDLDEIRLFDRADGVKGHYCIGFKDTSGTCHFWGGHSGKYGWCSAGMLFVGEQAGAVIALLKSNVCDSQCGDRVHAISF